MLAQYNHSIVALSYVVAVIASYVALHMASRVSASRGTSMARYWLAAGSVAMGAGIWSMHFVGMLAFSLPIAVPYSVPVTLLSLVFAIGASAIALHTISRGALSHKRLLTAGVVMGCGIGLMHYTGMAALEIAPHQTYDPALLVLSIVIAIAASVAAMWICFQLKSDTGATAFWKRFFNQYEVQRLIGVRSRGATVFWKRFFNQSPNLICICDFDGRFRRINPAWETLGYSREELMKMRLMDIVHVDDHPVLAKAVEKLTHGEATLSAEYRCRCADGSYKSLLWNATPSDDRQGFYATGHDISDRKRAEMELEQTHKRLREVSRQSGMAEVATNVLHNVGNVLNSVNVSAGLVRESVKNSRAASMAKIVALMREHKADLGSYITNDPKGQHIPAFLEQLSVEWLAQQQTVVKELDSLRANIDHIKEIVAMQQNHAKVFGTAEMVNVVDLVEDSLRVQKGTFVKHNVEAVREFEEVPMIRVEKHKVMQILVNLLNNAEHACDELGGEKKRMTVRIAQVDDRIRISVSDNGIGIAPENLTRIFSHGFTTRKEGHGFGLHSGALAATELGGSLSVHSDGPGKGATFTLDLPQQPTGIRT